VNLHSKDSTFGEFEFSSEFSSLDDEEPAAKQVTNKKMLYLSPVPHLFGHSACQQDTEQFRCSYAVHVVSAASS
jgi:hypothetical protein